MFTGIIEALGRVEQIERAGTNVHFTISSSISDTLKIDQSLAHDGVCLTVVAMAPGRHTVTAIEETMNRTKLAEWKTGSLINLERAMIANARLDGHMVQGHVDTVGQCTKVEEAGGSWYVYFEYDPAPNRILVDKGSVCINGVSLTVIEPSDRSFHVAIIPYTFEHTNFQEFRPGTPVNLEFDIIGKYLAKYMEVYR
ncbi:MAG: riboflavin synthase [Saprospiraceae bacterium]|nr:riboflavin synthase [Saprospiraceae bacterium]